MESSDVLSRVGSRWQDRMGTIREYSVIRDGNIFQTSFSDSYVYHSEFERACLMRERLLQDYEGLDFDGVFRRSPTGGGSDACPAIISHEDIRLPLIDPETVREAILSELTLVYGLGGKTAGKLKQRGYSTIPDLQSHPKYRAGAKEFLRYLDIGFLPDIIAWLSRRNSASRPLALATSCLTSPESLVFFDIETLGLFSRPIILFGVGRLESGKFTVYQYLLRDVSEELPALLAMLSHLEGTMPALVSFNGKTFDFPYLRDRLAFYGIPLSSGIPHFDILHMARRRWKDTVPNCRLSTLERLVFGILRKDDLPSQMVPEFYETYLKTGNIGPLVPIVEHNRQDVISLARLYGYLLEEWHACF